jgi:hypothetical protein
MRLSCAMISATVVLALSACPGADGGVGAHCDRVADCDDSLQCVDHTCVPLCLRAPDCGDGYLCDENGYCIAGTGQSGDPCSSEVECEAGLACELDREDGDGDGFLGAQCSPDNEGGAPGAPCDVDDDCRNSTCALGRCVDVCSTDRGDRDCPLDHTCTTIPWVQDVAPHPAFYGCLPSSGTISWSLAIDSPAASVPLPVPGNARSIVVVMKVDDAIQDVGATRLTQPDGTVVYDLPYTAGALDPAKYFANVVRHAPDRGQSVLMVPSSPTWSLELGAYELAVSSLRLGGVVGSAIPRVTAIAKLGISEVLDLHFYFLDLEDHPCQAAIGPTKLDASSAPTLDAFQSDFLNEGLRDYLDVAPGVTTYDDVSDHADLDGLDASQLSSLLAETTRPGGVNVFFTRTLSPVGLQSMIGGAPNPGDPQVGSPIGGIAIGIDTLCYRSWSDLARITAHAIGRQMGLYRNVEPGNGFTDPIVDSDTTANNLMHFSEFGGTTLSPGQHDILERSAVLK